MYLSRLKRIFSHTSNSALEFLVHYPSYLRYRSRRSETGEELEVVFIVGAPRTGSTILYQALTNCFRAGYIDNLSARWSRDLSFGSWLSRKKFNCAPHNNYMANLGCTSEFGEHAPSEAGEFWYRWLPREDHYIAKGTISRKSVFQMREEIRSAYQMGLGPFVIKNLNMGQRLGLISEFAPEAKIIFIRRDPYFTVRSILNARRKEGCTSNDWWSVRPKNFRELLGFTEVEKCVAQVYFLEEQIKRDLELFPSENVKTVEYNQLSEKTVTDLALWSGAKPRVDVSFPVFTKDNRDDMPKSTMLYLKAFIEKYDFDKDMFC